MSGLSRVGYDSELRSRCLFRVSGLGFKLQLGFEIRGIEHEA